MAEQIPQRNIVVAGCDLPPLIGAAGERACYRFAEFLTAQIRNEHTRLAYGRALRNFFDWCQGDGRQMSDMNSVIVTAYIA